MTRIRAAIVRSMSRRGCGTLPASVRLCVFAAGSPAFGQASTRLCLPTSERSDEVGPTCSTGALRLGPLPPGPLAWHLDTYSTRAAAEAAKGPRGTVVESLGQIWLFSIDEVGWRPPVGTRVAESGPLPVDATTDYTAVYMEAIFDPGMTAAIHSHSGPEAFYTVTGETCLETPGGVLTGRAGGPVVIVPGGPPMLLTATGAIRRRGVVLILHDSSQPATSMVHDWTPKGLCHRTA